MHQAKPTWCEPGGRAMANVLLVDPQEVARKALKGILARGNHRFLAAPTAREAWDFIQRNVKIDLVIVELQLEGEDGLAFVARLREDALLKLLPVVIYTATTNRESVARAMKLGVQNFLMKPYRDEDVFAEIAKGHANPWRQLHFEEQNSFCRMVGLTVAELRQKLEALRTSLTTATGALGDAAAAKNAEGSVPRLQELSTSAESAGAWGVVECVARLIARAESSAWAEFSTGLAELAFAGRMIFYHLNPDILPAEFLSTEEVRAKAEEQARARWFNAAEQNQCPVVTRVQLESQLKALAGCPVIDSVAAGFQMNATGHPSSLAPLMDLAEKDPGLAAHLLIATNQLRPNEKDDVDPTDNPRICIGLLGEVRLAALANSMVLAEERHMQGPTCSWPHFWMLQMGVARMARYTCHYLELYSLEGRAFTAGLLHDLGKLLLLHLHPHGFAAILDHARRHSVPLREAEKLFLGMTTQEMAAYFAEEHKLPKSYCHVIRWVADPAQATESAELVAIVSLAHEICLQNHVGSSGDTPKKHGLPLAETPAWRILSAEVFPSFDLKKFEAEAHAECRRLRQELHGRITG